MFWQSLTIRSLFCSFPSASTLPVSSSFRCNPTDAEGRLVLADALYYVSSTYKPTHIIDLATLTGAMMIALGSVYTGAFCSSQALADKLVAAGQTAGDKIWPMPLDQTYLGQMVS